MINFSCGIVSGICLSVLALMLFVHHMQGQIITQIDDMTTHRDQWECVYRRHT